MSSTALGALIENGTERLSGISSSPRLDTEVLLAETVGKPRSFLFAWPDWSPGDSQVAAFEEALARREQGEPVAYITGWREFWSIWFKVTPDVLIPRPETERLVELVLEQVPEDAAFRIADIGTGSGAIALALARERPACRFLCPRS